ncbi:MAG: hypothetical protein NXI31_21560 [bacterium]|nr:hypothetical protein [bacterium]
MTVHPGERTTVRMVQFNGGRMFTLQNASSGSAHDVYKNKRSDPLTKVVDDELLQRLLDVLAERGLFQTATPAAPSSARDALIIDHNSPGSGSRRYVIHREGLPLAEAQRYLEAKKYFLDVYNRAEAFHTADINRTDLRNEGDRARYDADRARRKLERLKERGK